MQHFLKALALNFGGFAVYTLLLALVQGVDGFMFAFFISVAHAVASVIAGVVLMVISAQSRPDKPHLNQMGIGLMISGLIIPVIGFGVCAANVSFH